MHLQPSRIHTSDTGYQIYTHYLPFDLSAPPQIFGPVLTVLTFRTPKEAIALANNTVFGLGASVWTENISLGLEVAISLKAGACWVNCHNMFDAAAGFGGYRESGFGRDGGKEVSLLGLLFELWLSVKYDHGFDCTFLM